MYYWIICYDISEDRVRDQIHRYLVANAEAVQESVFELACRSVADFDRIWQDLLRLLGDAGAIRAYRSSASLLRASRVAGSAAPKLRSAIVIL
jgi:CRISPR-associated endonuclease Cas2